MKAMHGMLKVGGLAWLLGWLTADAGWAQSVGRPLPVWREGLLDIHQLSTGQGNAALVVLPDGTSLLIDAGAVNRIDWRTGKPRRLPTKPSPDRAAGEWIARYARKALRFQSTPALDYALITHFHDDHMGSPLHVARKSVGGYRLAGITEVAEYLPIRRILDRGWPDYTYPQPFDQDSMVLNYRQFLTWQIQHNGLVAARFEAGRADEIQLLRNPAPYRSQVSIQNIVVNGNVWTGIGQATRALFPKLATLQPAEYPSENMCSIGLRIRYGAFDYFTGGDLPGTLLANEPTWHDVESPVAAAVGAVDVQLLDHHGYPDSENETLLKGLKPRVLVVPAWAVSHPGRGVLERVYSERLYAGERDVFVTNLLDETKLALGDLLPRLKSTAGHVVVRVEPGGGAYRIFILEDGNESQRVKAVYGPYHSR